MLKEMIVRIKGNVKHPITLDPGVWIFDDRRFTLDAFFSGDVSHVEHKEVKALGDAWDNQRKGLNPQSNQNIIHVDKKDLTENSLAVPLKPFLDNAALNDDAEFVHLMDGSGNGSTITKQEAESGILAFSKEGRPLKDTGPVHFYFGDGSNEGEPITHIEVIEIV